MEYKGKLYRHAYDYFKHAHESTNHTYDGKPYFDYHVLDVVENWGARFLYLIPEQHRERVMAALLGHDTIEDCRLTYNDVYKEFIPYGEDVAYQIAEFAFSLTNKRGRTRAERADDEYYDLIVVTPYAAWGKICDRLSNASRSVSKGHGMSSAYVKEYTKFKDLLFADLHYAEMWHELDNMLIHDFKFRPEIKRGTLVNVCNKGDVIFVVDEFIVSQSKVETINDRPPSLEVRVLDPRLSQLSFVPMVSLRKIYN